MGREVGFEPTQTAPEANIIKRNVAENIFGKIFFLYITLLYPVKLFPTYHFALYR